VDGVSIELDKGLTIATTCTDTAGMMDATAVGATAETSTAAAAKAEKEVERRRVKAERERERRAEAARAVGRPPGQSGNPHLRKAGAANKGRGDVSVSENVPVQLQPHSDQ